jgi:tetratricopeptide (TPR) repeat protein
MTRSHILFAFALSLVATGAFARQDARDSLIVYYTDGVRLATEERFEEARQRFERALALDPTHDPSLFEMANVLAAGGDTAGALEYSARAAALDPANSWYRGQQGRFLVALERYDEALELFEGSVAGDEFDPDNYRMLALLYYRKGRTDDALATLDSAGVRMGPTPEITEMKRGILIEADRLDDAVELTENYVRAMPYDEAHRLALAGIYVYQGRDSLGVAMLKQVLDINPDNVDALEALAEIYRVEGEPALQLSALKQLFSLPEVDLKKKIERFEALALNTNFYRAHFFEMGELALTIVTTHPGQPEAVELYADHAVRGGDAEGALTMLKGQLARGKLTGGGSRQADGEADNSQTLSAFMKVIEIEAYLKRPDSLALWSDRALKVYPDRIDIYMLRSGALQYMGRNKEARKSLSGALKVAQTDSLRSEVWGAIGTLWHEEGNNKKTFAAYDKALAFGSNNALVLNNYAYFLAEEGRDLDRALGMAQRAVKLQENFATYLDTYAWVLFKTGDAAGARRVMQQALPLDRDNSAELLMHYGDILWALNEKFMASVYWKRARDAGWQPVAEIEERLSRK